MEESTITCPYCHKTIGQDIYAIQDQPEEPEAPGEEPETPEEEGDESFQIITHAKEAINASFPAKGNIVQVKSFLPYMIYLGGNTINLMYEDHLNYIRYISWLNHKIRGVTTYWGDASNLSGTKPGVTHSGAHKEYTTIDSIPDVFDPNPKPLEYNYKESPIGSIWTPGGEINPDKFDWLGYYFTMSCLLLVQPYHGESRVSGYYALHHKIKTFMIDKAKSAGLETSHLEQIHGDEQHVNHGHSRINKDLEYMGKSQFDVNIGYFIGALKRSV